MKFILFPARMSCMNSYYQWHHEHSNGLSVDLAEDGIRTLKCHSLRLVVHQCPYVLAYAFSNCHRLCGATYLSFCSPIAIWSNDGSIWQVHDEFVLQLEKQ